MHDAQIAGRAALVTGAGSGTGPLAPSCWTRRAPRVLLVSLSDGIDAAERIVERAGAVDVLVSNTA